METIAEAKAYLAANIRGGCRCPVCQQHVKLYRRKLDSTMAVALAGFYRFRRDGLDWVYPRRDIGRGKSIDGHHAKLRYWGLIEENPEKPGFWRITQKGVDFVDGRIGVPRFAYTYNASCLALDARETITFAEAVCDKFDLRELLKA